jgi:hypothetical protein
MQNEKQSTLLGNLEERLKAANELHEEAVALQTFYESGTVATMKDLRANGLPRPLPQDDPLFREVDLVLVEIRRSYERLKRFWEEEIRHVIEALKEGRTDPRDFENWGDIRSNLKQTIEFWKSWPPSGNAQSPRDVPPVRSNFLTPSSTGVYLGEIAFSLSSTIDSLGEALERISSSASLQYSELRGRSDFERVYIAFAGNSDMCLSFLCKCADYGEKAFAWCFPSIASPASTRVGTPYDVGERSMGLRSEVTEGMGGVGALLRGLATHHTHGLSSGAGTPPTRHASPDSTLRSFTMSRADKDLPKLDFAIKSPAGEPQGLLSTVGREGGQRILGEDILPKRPSERFLHLTWWPLEDKVLVLLSIYAIIVVAILSLALGHFQGFGTTHPPGIPQ